MTTTKKAMVTLLTMEAGVGLLPHLRQAWMEWPHLLLRQEWAGLHPHLPEPWALLRPQAWALLPSLESSLSMA